MVTIIGTFVIGLIIVGVIWFLLLAAMEFEWGVSLVILVIPIILGIYQIGKGIVAEFNLL